MAKQKSPPNPPSPTSSPTAAAVPVPATPRDDIELVLIEAPILRAYGFNARVLRALDTDEATAFGALAAGLAADKLCLSDGHPIEGTRDAISWIAERINAAKTKSAAGRRQPAV